MIRLNQFSIVLRLYAKVEYSVKDNFLVLQDDPLISISYKGVQLPDGDGDVKGFNWFSDELELTLADVRFDFSHIEYTAIRLYSDILSKAFTLVEEKSQGNIQCGFISCGSEDVPCIVTQDYKWVCLHNKLVPMLVQYLKDKEPKINLFAVTEKNELSLLHMDSELHYVVQYPTKEIDKMSYVKARLLLDLIDKRDSTECALVVSYGNITVKLSQDGIELNICKGVIGWNDNNDYLLELLPYLYARPRNTCVIELPKQLVYDRCTLRESPCCQVQSIWCPKFVGFFVESDYCIIKNEEYTPFVFRFSDCGIKHTYCNRYESGYVLSSTGKASWQLMSCPNLVADRIETHGLYEVVQARDYDKLAKALDLIDKDLVDRLDVLLEQM